MIEKRGENWVVVAKMSGKILGTFSSKAQALKRLREIEFFKHQDEECMVQKEEP